MSEELVMAQNAAFSLELVAYLGKSHIIAVEGS
jgi:hypothetical protein